MNTTTESKVAYRRTLDGTDRQEHWYDTRAAAESARAADIAEANPRITPGGLFDEESRELKTDGGALPQPPPGSASGAPRTPPPVSVCAGGLPPPQTAADAGAGTRAAASE